MDFFRFTTTEEHFMLCYGFAHFKAFGTLELSIAQDFVEAGDFIFKEVPLSPLSTSFTVAQLTREGRLKSKNLCRLWEKMYRPELVKQNWTIKDEYESQRDSLAKFVMSADRFKAEKAVGNLNEVIRRCGHGPYD